jgi:1-acyl-sn-glycerol-3-phosphate acyltransferase
MPLDVPDGFDPDGPAALGIRAALKWLAARHQHRACGVENIPAGPCLLVVNHSLATYDIGLLMLAVWDMHHRLPRSLGDKRLFHLPWAARAAQYMGAQVASPTAGEELLADGRIVLVAPGGMKEAIRPSDERYRLRWADRKGFVRLALSAQVPIVLAACPRADDLYRVYRSGLTDAIYDLIHLPVPLFKGRGWSLLPDPVQLVHLVDEPIVPPDVGPDDQDALHTFHAHVVERMEALMERALEPQL